MNARVASTIAALIVVTLDVWGAPGQGPAPSAPAPATPQLAPEQLDQLVAPIALYPDPLIAQILMAATYPLEVVEADRWLQDSQNASLKDDELTAALDEQTWDPSVKSLVPFPQILRMMDANLDWTERLGEAFLADQAALMDSVQRLRWSAEAAGTLRSTPQEVVTTEGQVITIEPASPEIVYVPVYDPTVVYGVWPYPAFPPFYFPGFFDGVIIGAFGFGWWGFGIVAPLWGWHHWDWHRHRIDIDRDRFTALNHQHPPLGSAWEHDPSHRHSVPYRNPGVRDRFAGNLGAPEARRAFRGYPTGAPAQVRPTPAPAVQHAQAPQVVRPPPSPRFPPTFESFGRGADVRAEAERGHASRMSVPAYQPRATGSRPAPSGGGRGHR